MRTSQCQVLTDACTAKVYATNSFHILGLSPLASGRDVRRRREDLESAHAMGASSWESEFKHLLGNIQIPDYETVEESFRRIEDPQKRIVDEFFWFWPVDRDDDAFESLLSGKESFAEKIWKRSEQSGDIRRSVIARHNLAVLNHFYAIDSEWQFIANDMGKYDDPGNHAKMCAYWKEAFERWEILADDEDFWDLMKDRVVEIGDNRLTSGFIRRMRDEFPIAFDRINGDFAVEYAKLDGKQDETDRHLRYMNESHQGLDDVQSTLDAIFDPIEREVDLFTKEAGRVLHTAPHSALAAARSLLKSTETIRKLLDMMLGKDNPRRNKIFNKIVSECNFCQVAYGNKTKQWEECIKLLEEIIPLASDEELISVLTNNLKISKENFEDYKRENYCWFCQKHPADTRYAIKVKMYGDVRIETFPFSNQYRATWRNIEVTIPRCKHCEEEVRKREAEATAAYKEYQDARNRRSGWNKFWDVETDETKQLNKQHALICERNYKSKKQEESRQKEFPLYKELAKHGFKEGEKPTQMECEGLYRLKKNNIAMEDIFRHVRANSYGGGVTW